MKARRTIDERARLVDRQEIVQLLLWVDRVEVSVLRVTQVARSPPVPAIETAISLGEQAVSDLAEGGCIACPVSDPRDLHGRARDTRAVGQQCNAGPTVTVGNDHAVELIQGRDA